MVASCAVTGQHRLQVATCNICVFTGALQALLGQLQSSRMSKLSLDEGGSGKAALAALCATFQELYDVLSAPAQEYALLKQFPYSAVGGATLAGRLEGAVRELHEVCYGDAERLLLPK